MTLLILFTIYQSSGNETNSSLNQVLDIEIPNETTETANLLDAFKERLVRMPVERSDMTVIASEVYNNANYAVIATFGDPPLLYLVEYTLTDDGHPLIIRDNTGAYALSLGITPNFIIWDDVAIFWSDIKATRLGRDETGGWSKQIQNDFTSIQFTFSNGDVISYDVTCPGAVLKFFSADNIPVLCELYHGGEATGVSFELE